jgi:hypothetical protein
MVLGFEVFRPSSDPDQPGLEQVCVLRLGVHMLTHTCGLLWQVKELQRNRFKDVTLADQVCMRVHPTRQALVLTRCPL